MANDKLQVFCILTVVVAALCLVEIEGQQCSFEMHKEVGCRVCGQPNYSNADVSECRTCCNELFPGKNVSVQWQESSGPDPNALPYCVCNACQDRNNPKKKCKTNLHN